jgi:hypothetical protein
MHRAASVLWGSARGSFEDGGDGGRAFTAHLDAIHCLSRNYLTS